jgi:hypothetical protein
MPLSSTASCLMAVTVKEPKVSPVPIEETLEIFTFMEAADESKRRGGVPVSLAEVKALHSRSR